LILAELAPDRATDILVRSRRYAANRVICGAHNQSAVEAGKTVAVAIIAVLHSSPEFRNDMADAGADGRYYCLTPILIAAWKRVA
jgi:acid phosphatase (class A)